MEHRFALLTEKQIKRASHRSTAASEQAIRDDLTMHNRNPEPFAWSKSADDFRASLARFCKRISDSRHLHLPRASRRFWSMPRGLEEESMLRDRNDMATGVLAAARR